MTKDKEVLKSTWKKNAKRMAEKVLSGKNVVYITVGDRFNQTAGGLGRHVVAHHIGESMLGLGDRVVHDFLVEGRHLDGSRHVFVGNRAIIGAGGKAHQ